MGLFNLIIYSVLIILGISFAALNAESVLFNYYFNSINVPLSALLIGSLALGLMIGLITSLFKIVKLSWENKRLKKRLDFVEKEVAQLKVLAISNNK